MRTQERIDETPDMTVANEERPMRMLRYGVAGGLVGWAVILGGLIELWRLVH